MLKGYLIVDHHMLKMIKSEGIVLNEQVYVILKLLSEKKQNSRQRMM